MKKKRQLTYELCKEEISKYSTYSELYQSDPAIIMKIKKKGWEELISHWTLPHSSTNPKWTYEKCKEEISKYTYLSELQGTSVLNAILKKGWYEELITDLIRQQHKPYTEEEVRTEALKYNTRADFQRKSGGEYNAGFRLNIIEDACKHMGKAQNVKQYSKEEILESARRHDNQRDWIINEPTLYTTGVGYNKKKSSDEDKEFWEECISHMEYLMKPNGYWTYEKCEEVAYKYNERSEFHKNEPEAYKVIVRDGYDDLLSHMDWTTPNGYKKYPKGYFDDINKCRKEALKYKSRTDMCDNSNYAYTTVLKNGWQSDCFKHMIRHSTDKPRYIYVFEFNQLNPPEAYIGLTCKWQRRQKDHYKKGTVCNRIEETSMYPEFKLLTDTPVKEREAPKEEEYYMNVYEEQGYILLNKAKAGSLGGKRSIWTKDNIWKIVSECNSMAEFYDKTNGNCIMVCRELNIYDEIINILKTDTDSKIHVGGWTTEDALIEANKYEYVGHFQKACSGGYKYLDRLGLLKSTFEQKNIDRKKLFDDKYSKENCKIQALKYKTRSEFAKGAGMYYRECKINKWDDILEHMGEPHSTRNKRRPNYIRRPQALYVGWTYDRLKECTSEFNTITEFANKYRTGYKYMKANGYDDEFFPLYERGKSKEKPKLWTYDKLKEIVTECRNRSDLQKKYSGAYKFAKKYGYINEFFPPEGNRLTNRKTIYWTYDRLKEVVDKCTNKSEFIKKYSGAYKYAKRHNHIEEFFPILHTSD